LQKANVPAAKCSGLSGAPQAFPGGRRGRGVPKPLICKGFMRSVALRASVRSGERTFVDNDFKASLKNRKNQIIHEKMEKRKIIKKCSELKF
jgi:hypothetical protein